MSRIIKSIIDSVFEKSNLVAVVFLDHNRFNNKIINLPFKLCVFEAHQGDLNKKLIIVNPNNINNNLSFRPDCTVIDTMGHYENAKNLSNIFRIPLINLVNNKEDVKKDAIFSIARNSSHEDINILTDELADFLHITDYSLPEDNLSTQILKEVNKWKHV